MEKYEPLGVVGEGSYGVVLKCRHRESGRSVAIKKFIDSEDDQNVRKIALREIRVLRKLRHENLVNLLEVFRRRKHLYLVFEFIDHTLLDEMEGKPGGLDGEVCRKYVYQLLRGLGFCHDNNIIHRDVKPENILVSKNGIVKLCDFGFARNMGGPGENMTDYVATRWYRAPELLVGDIAYGKEVDIWAVGCLFAEMMSGEPLFPGDSDIDQLFLIAQCLGRLSRRHLNIMQRNSAFRNFQLPKLRNGSTTSTDSNSTSSRPKLAKMDTGSRMSSTKSNGGSGSYNNPLRNSGGINKNSNVDTSVFSKMFPNWSDEAIYFITVSLDPEPSRRPPCNALMRSALFTHDNFPSRFINELNQKLQLEGRHPIPAYSTRKKRSVLGTLKGSNLPETPPNHHNSVTNLSKKNPLYQARLNLAEEPSSTKYSDTFPSPQKQPPKEYQQRYEGNSNSYQNSKFTFSRDQTFLVEKVPVHSKLEKEVVKHQNGMEPSESRIPTLLSRKYSDDFIFKNVLSIGGYNNGNNNTSKSTPSIVVPEDRESNFGSSSTTLPPPIVSKEKRFSIQNSQIPAFTSSTFTQQSQPRKFSYSFPPPDSRERENSNSRAFGDENGNRNHQKMFQTPPVTNLTFTVGNQSHSQSTNLFANGLSSYPYNSSNNSNPFSKSPTASILNATGLLHKRTPTPKILKNGESSSGVSNYFPQTHFNVNSSNSNSNGIQQTKYPVSFYQNPGSDKAKSLPVTMLGSSMTLKNPMDPVGGGDSSFLPRMAGNKTTTKDESINSSSSSLLNNSAGFSKFGMNSLPKRRDSFVGKLDSPQASAASSILSSMPKGVSKHVSLSNEPITSLSIAGSSTSSPAAGNNVNVRHFTTYATQ